MILYIFIIAMLHYVAAEDIMIQTGTIFQEGKDPIFKSNPLAFPTSRTLNFELQFEDSFISAPAKAFVAFSSLTLSSSYFDISVQVLNSNSSKLRAQLQVGPNASCLNFGVSFMALASSSDSNGIVIIPYDYTSHPSFLVFSAQNGTRTLNYRVNYAVTNPLLYSNSAGYVTFNQFKFNMSSTLYQIDCVVTGVTNSYIDFTLTTYGDTKIINLAGTILILSDATANNFGVDSTNFTITSGSILSNPPDSTIQTVVTRGFFSKKIYTLTPNIFLFLGSFSMTNSSPTAWNEFKMGIDNFQHEVILFSSTINSNLLYNQTVNAIAICSDSNTCIQNVTNNTLCISTNNYLIDLKGIPISKTQASTRSFTLEGLFQDYYNNKPNYMAIGISGLNVNANNLKLSVVLNSWDKKGFKYTLSAGPNDNIDSIGIVTLTSCFAGIQTIFYDFSTHSNFASTFGNVVGASGSTKNLTYIIPFTQTTEISINPEAFVLFTEYSYTSTDSFFTIFYNQTGSTSSSVTITIFASAFMRLTVLKGYIVIATTTSTKYNVDLINFHENSQLMRNSTGTRSIYQTLQSSSKFNQDPLYMPMITGFSWNRSSGGDSMIHINLRNTNVYFNMANRYAYITTLLNLEGNTIFYDVYYTNFGFVNNRTGAVSIIDQVRYGSDPYTTQNYYLAADFGVSSYSLILTDRSQIDGCELVFSNSIATNIARFVRAVKYQRVRNNQGVSEVNPIEVSSSAILTFHSVLIINSNQWCVSGYSNVIDDWPLAQSEEQIIGLPSSQSLTKTYSNVRSSIYFLTNISQSTFCGVEVNFQGIIRGLYLNNELVFAGSSEDLSTASIQISTRKAILYPGEIIYVFILGSKYTVTDFKLSNCTTSSGTPVIVQTNSFNFNGTIESIDLAYPTGSDNCAPNCKLCLHSTYCFECNVGYFLSSGLCLTTCPRNNPVVLKTKYCDISFKNLGQKQTSSLYNFTSNEISTSYRIDLHYRDESFFLISYFPSPYLISNSPYLFSSNSIASLSEGNQKILNGTLSNDSVLIQGKSFISKATVDNYSNLAISIHKLKRGYILLTTFTSSNDIYGIGSYYLLNTNISLALSSFYRIQFIFYCLPGVNCRLVINSSGNVVIYRNERTILLNSQGFEVDNYEISRNFVGYNQITVIIRSSRWFQIDILGAYDLYSQQELIMVDTIDIGSNNCQMDLCQNCLDNNTCVSCQRGAYLLYDFKKCGKFCLETNLDSMFENRCLCHYDAECGSVLAGRCDTALKLCMPCNAHQQCDHFYTGVKGNCASGLCYSCPEDCDVCVNETYCRRCSSNFMNIDGTCFIICDPGMRNISRDVCVDICGDGIKPLHSNTTRCDDNNTISGDGCNSNCQVENGYECIGGGPSSRDYCGLIPKMKVVPDSNIKTKFHLLFNVDMALPNDITSLIDLKFIFLDDSTVTYKIIKTNQTIYELDIVNTKTIPQQLMILSFRNISLIKSKLGISMKKSDYMITIDSIDYISSRNKDSLIAVSAVIGGSFSSGLDPATANPNLVWLFISLMQFYYYLLFINCKYPKNVESFFGLFAMGRLDFLPNPFKSWVLDINYTPLPAPKKFEEQKLSGFFLLNSGSMISTWLIFWGLYALYYLSYPVTRDTLSPLRGLLGRFKKFFEWSGALNLWITYYLDLSISCLLQLRVLSFESGMYTASSLAAIAFFFANLALFCLMLSMSYSWDYYSHRRKSFFKNILINYKFTFPSRYFLVFQIIRKLITSFILVFAHDYPFFEINALILVNTVPWIMSVLANPYVSKYERICSIANESTYFLMLVFIYFLIIDNKNSFFDDNERFLVGWIIIGLCMLAVVINIIVTVVRTLKWFLYAIKKKNQPIISLKRRMRKKLRLDLQDKKKAKKVGIKRKIAVKDL